MHTLLTTLIALMFVVRALPAKALTLRDMGDGIGNYVAGWQRDMDCLTSGPCKIWDTPLDLGPWDRREV